MLRGKCAERSRGPAPCGAVGLSGSYACMGVVSLTVSVPGCLARLETAWERSKTLVQDLSVPQGGPASCGFSLKR